MPKDADDRITELEIQLAHLQRMFEQLDEVVTQQSLQVDKLQREQVRLREKLESVKNTQNEGGADPLEEKPPHY